MIDGHRNHPSIVMWVLFNEGWGQSDSERLSGKTLTQLVDEVGSADNELARAPRTSSSTGASRCRWRRWSSAWALSWGSIPWSPRPTVQKTSGSSG